MGNFHGGSAKMVCIFYLFFCAVILLWGSKKKWNFATPAGNCRQIQTLSWVGTRWLVVFTPPEVLALRADVAECYQNSDLYRAHTKMGVDCFEGDCLFSYCICPTRKKCDVDNFCKAVIDELFRCKIIKDDSQIQRVTGFRCQKCRNSPSEKSAVTVFIASSRCYQLHSCSKKIVKRHWTILGMSLGVKYWSPPLCGPP